MGPAVTFRRRANAGRERFASGDGDQTRPAAQATRPGRPEALRCRHGRQRCAS